MALPASAATTSVVSPAPASSNPAVEDGTNDGETADDQGVEDGTNDGETADDQVSRTARTTAKPPTTSPPPRRTDHLSTCGWPPAAHTCSVTARLFLLARASATSESILRTRSLASRV
jgi:hypothetical protein